MLKLFLILWYFDTFWVHMTHILCLHNMKWPPKFKNPQLARLAHQQTTDFCFAHRPLVACYPLASHGFGACHRSTFLYTQHLTDFAECCRPTWRRWIFLDNDNGKVFFLAWKLWFCRWIAYVSSTSIYLVLLCHLRYSLHLITDLAVLFDGPRANRRSVHKGHMSLAPKATSKCPTTGDLGTTPAPRDADSKPTMPEPAKRSKTREVSLSNLTSWRHGLLESSRKSMKIQNIEMFQATIESEITHRAVSYNQNWQQWFAKTSDTFRPTTRCQVRQS